MIRTNRGKWRWPWLAVVLLGVLLLGACTSTDRETLDALGGQEDPLDQRRERNDITAAWLDSLRTEANWLWASADIAQSAPGQVAERCPAPGVTHTPLSLTAEERADDDVSAKMIDLLDYAQQLIAQSREQWNANCGNPPQLGNTVAFIRSRLNPAYTTMDEVQQTVDKRREVLDK